MPEKPQEKKPSGKEIERTDAEKPKEDEFAWSKDQKEKSYYYDDACGYEIYNPEDDDKEEQGE
jgi:hypothetical protein